MWDRFRQKDGGAPHMSRKKLEAWQNSKSSRRTSLTPSSPVQGNNNTGIYGGNSLYQYSVRGGPAPPRPRRNGDVPPDHNPGYVTAAPPVQALHSARNTNRRSSYGRPASSLYSQPSPEAATFAARELRADARGDPNNISPPSSPDIAATRVGPNPGDVSPIEESPDMSHVNSERPPSSRAGERSNIPTMRRERRKNSDAARNALREAQSRERLKPLRPHGSDVRWDPRTGEPTTGPKGKPSQINPQEYVQGIGSQAKPLAPPLPNQAPSEVSWVERARRLQQANANPRPEWKGASGRENFVAPVNDNKDAPPLKPPPRDGRRAARGPAVSTPDDATKPETSLAAPGAQGRSDSAEPTSARQVRGAVPPPQSYPSPPLSDDNSGPAKRAIPTTTSAQPSHKSLRPLQIPSTEKAIRRKPAGAAAHRPDNATPSPAQTPQHDLHPSQVPPGAFPSEWTQPPSRFSVTTAATSNPASTPRQSLGNDVPSLPTPPPQEQVSPKPAPGSSILDRRRPVVSGFEASPRQSPTTETVKISMDSPYYTPTSSSTMTKTRTTGPRPVAGGASAMGRHANTSTLSVDSTATTGTDKMLPPAPPEVEGAAAQDRVAQLNARLTALAQRRQNLHTAIRQMTELMPADNLLAAEAVVRKREAEKRKVENLRAELADVENDSYQLGLKLHRAYKRLDRDAEYEPTTLWVRRVTG